MLAFSKLKQQQQEYERHIECSGCEKNMDFSCPSNLVLLCNVPIANAGGFARSCSLYLLLHLVISPRFVFFSFLGSRSHCRMGPLGGFVESSHKMNEQ